MSAGQGETAEQESGYRILLRNVAALIEDTDPGAAAALLRVGDEVERLLARVQEAEARAENGEGFRRSMYALESRVQELTDDLERQEQITLARVRERNEAERRVQEAARALRQAANLCDEVIDDLEDTCDCEGHVEDIARYRGSLDALRAVGGGPRA